MDSGKFILRDYQQDVVARVLEAWRHHRSVMVQMPTGTGKTHVLAAIVRNSLPQDSLTNESLTPCPSPRERGVDTISKCDGNYNSNKETEEKHITPLSLGEGAGVRLSGIRLYGPIWIIAHRRELVAQIEETIQKMYAGVAGDSSLFILHSSFTKSSSFIKVMSIQWLSRHWDDISGRPSLIVIDEAHHALADTYRELWTRYPEAKKLGMTATPCRMNRRGFTDLFDVLLTSWSVAEFIRKGQLSLFDYVSLKPGGEEQRLIDSLEKRGADGDYQTKEMNSVLNRRPSIERLYQSMEKYARGRKGIVYAISIEHARSIAEYYNSKGVGTAVIDSRTPAEERRRIVEEFRRSPSGLTNSLTNSLTPCPSPRERGVDTISKCDGNYNGNKETEEKHITPLSLGEGSGVRLSGLSLPVGRLSVLVNVDVFSEGFDCPDVEFVQLARPTLSLAKYLQQVGRGLRRSAGKEACVIIDNVGLYRVFGLPTVEWDWQAMFRGAMSGKSMHTANMRNSTGMTALHGEPVSRREDGMEIIVSHEQLLEEIDNLKDFCPVVENCGGLKSWQDRESGLWGLRLGRNRITEAMFITVFDIRYGMAAVRFKNKECGIVNDAGDVIWRKAGCLRVMFLKDRLLQVVAHNREYYIDMYSLRSYERRPKVRKYGNVELLEVDGVYYSRTKTVYVNNQGVCKHFIHWREFYLTIYDEKAPFPGFHKENMPTEHYAGHACILEDDNDSYYWLYYRLADGSIIITDNARKYYYATEGHLKRYIGCRDSEEEWNRCRTEIELLARQAEEKWDVSETERIEKRRQQLALSNEAVPFKSGVRWGLRVGNQITIPPIYRRIKSPVGKYCVVEKNYSQWGVVALDGTVMVEPQYSDIEINMQGIVTGTKITGSKELMKLP